MSFSIDHSLFDPQVCDDVLTSSQLEMSFTLRSFCEEAASCSSILSLMTGQTVAAFAKGSIFKALSLSFGNGARKLAAYHYTSSLIACGAEGIAFNVAGEVGKTGELRVGSWRENLHGFFTIGACKLIGARFGRSIVLQHGSQDLGMMFVDVACETVGIADVKHQGGVQRLLSAELATIRMGISARLTHTVCVEATYFQATTEVNYRIQKTEYRRQERGNLTQTIQESFGYKPVSANEAPTDLLPEFREPESKGGDRLAMSIDSSEDPRRFFDGPTNIIIKSTKTPGERVQEKSDRSEDGTTEEWVARTFARFLATAELTHEHSSSYYPNFARKMLSEISEFSSVPDQIERVVRAGQSAFPKRHELCRQYKLDLLQELITVFACQSERSDLIQATGAKLKTLIDYYGFEISPNLFKKVLIAVEKLSKYAQDHQTTDTNAKVLLAAARRAIPKEERWFHEWVILFYRSYAYGKSEHHLSLTLGTARLLRKITRAQMLNHGFSESHQEQFEPGKDTCSREYWREAIDLYAPTKDYSELTRKRLTRSYIATHFPDLPIWELPYYEEGSFIEEYEVKKVKRYFTYASDQLLGMRFFFARNRLGLSVGEWAKQEELSRISCEETEKNEIYPLLPDLKKRCKMLGMDYEEILTLLLLTHYPHLTDPLTGHPRLLREPIYISAKSGEEERIKGYIRNPKTKGEALFWGRKRKDLPFWEVEKQSEKLGLPLKKDELILIEENFRPPTLEEERVLNEIYEVSTLLSESKTEDWETRNQISEIEVARHKVDIEDFGDFVQASLKELGLGKVAFCGDLFNRNTFTDIQEGRRVDLEILYPLIQLFQKRYQQADTPAEKRVTSTAFYERYQPELFALPFYDPKSKFYFLRLNDSAHWREILETPITNYLRDRMEAKRWERSDLVRATGLDLYRVDRMLTGQLYILEFHEVVALAKVFDINLDEFYLRVHKEIPHFATVVHEETGEVLSSPPSDFSNLIPPDQLKAAPHPFVSALKRTQVRWKISRTDEMAQKLNILRQNLSSYLRGILPSLESFYDLLSQIEKVDREIEGTKLDQAALMERRVEYYLDYYPAVRKLKILDAKKRKARIIVPEENIDEWTEQKLKQTPFGWLVDKIQREAAEVGFRAVQSFSHEVGEVRGTINAFKQEGVLEIRWRFVERLAEFSRKHLKGKYDLSFIALLAHPEILDLADIENQREEVIYKSDPNRPLDYGSRYQSRLEKVRKRKR